MKTIMQHLFVYILIALPILSSCSVSSHVEKATGADLSKYKTFSWTTSERKSKASSEIIDNNIKAIIAEELGKKGLIQADSNPDLILDYSVTLPRNERRNRPAPVRVGGQVSRGGAGVFARPGVVHGNRYRNERASLGTLTINMLDAGTKRLVWQGWANDDINSRNITTKQVKKELKAIFKKFDNQ